MKLLNQTWGLAAVIGLVGVGLGACGNGYITAKEKLDDTGSGPQRGDNPGGDNGDGSGGDGSGGGGDGSGDGDGSGGGGSLLPVPASCEGGRVVYGIGGKHYRTTLGAQASHENLTQGLDALDSGEDNWMSSSPDGDWLIMETTRFDSACSGWSCLAVVKSDFSEGASLKIGGKVIHGENYAAIASGGKRVVYPLKGGPHEADLYVTNLSGNSWSSAKLLTADSSFPYNLQPSISDDGNKVVFDCGNDPYGQPPTSLCEVNTDGSGFHVVWTPEQGAEGVSGRSNVALHHPDYLANGSIVFEADWSGEQIWHLSGGGPPVVIANQYSNDNSPCALQSGCIVSIWLERPGSSGTHEIKVMDHEGGNFAMLRTNIDVVDTGTSCSR